MTVPPKGSDKKGLRLDPLCLAWLYPELRLFTSRDQRCRAYWAVVGRPCLWAFLGLMLCLMIATIVAKELGMLFSTANRWASYGAVSMALLWFPVTFVLPRRRIRLGLRRSLIEIGVPVCTHCGCDMRGLKEPRCPECGERVDVQAISKRR